MRWASRRGMLELDLLLEPFVTSRYAGLDERDRQRFQQLMGCEDQDLYAWFLRREKPRDQELQAIVSQILKFALTAPGDR
jgi:antitoxin CptB